jgi:hypothetical protein
MNPTTTKSCARSTTCRLALGCVMILQLILRCSMLLRRTKRYRGTGLAAAISKLLEYQTITVCTFESKKFAFAFLFVSRQFYTYTCRCTCKIGMKRGHVTTPTLNPKQCRSLNRRLKVVPERLSQTPRPSITCTSLPSAISKVIFSHRLVCSTKPACPSELEYHTNDERRSLAHD